MPKLMSAKIVIRCQNYLASREFYNSILDLPITDQWEEPGGKGCIFDVGGQGFIEIYEMTEAHPRYNPLSLLPVSVDKIDLQLRAESVDEWAKHLDGLWVFEGPERMEWGQRWIKLRDPDNLLISIYEGQI